MMKPRHLPGQELTEREIEVLEATMNGWTSREVAERLHVSRWTIQTHKSAILQKLHAHTMAQAAAIYIRHSQQSPRREVPPEG